MYQVFVSGSILYETSDVLVAHAVAKNYLTIGWKDVLVKESKT